MRGVQNRDYVESSSTLAKGVNTELLKTAN